ncbi:IclR family transcriptional regulator [Neorhizobium galegae]|uniref:IclR family transcriptional regulator n=1 Tax=Neorhizobium galegae TaxID=399 RepID=UPI001272D5D8|nr:IclR family transcriptional regulator [Neorhizobium galegae]KAA9384107.1 IclR family transcriptional regulator [Neorhizobium galegae]MCM2498756.1 IclR family transcriptional regulator [Neorhizobium galegae]
MSNSEVTLSSDGDDTKRRKPSAVTGLQIVEYLALNPRGARFRDIAAAVTMDPGQTHRIITKMAEDGWIIPVGEDGYYSLSARVIRLSTTYISKLDLAEHAQPFLNELSEETRESVFIGELRNDAIVCVGRRVADRTLRVWTEVGDSWPLPGSAVGTAVLAARAARLNESEKKVSKEIAAAWSLGYARDYGRYRDGVQAVAAPIRDASGVEIGALALSGPVSRIGEPEVEKMGPMARRAAEAISERLGYIAGSSDKF